MAPSLKAKWSDIVALGAALGCAFLMINWIHFQTLPVAVILYACIVDAILSSAIVGGVYWAFRRKKSPLLATETVLSILAANLLILLYSVMGPTVIDRSLSIYIVEKIDHRGGAVAEAAMPKIILTEFMQEYRVADVRMTEQVTSGTVKIEDGCIRMTPRGRTLAQFTRFFRRNFLPQHRRIADEITDELTHPYKDTPVLVPFKCPQR
ncbi:MAG: hypothetical protein ABJL57_03045 [Hyphomonas sp.]